MTMSTSTSRGQARRRAFLDAAQKVFLEQGLAEASVNDVVRLAGGSLATLYAQFGSKDGLFLAMFAERLQTLVEPMRKISASDRPLAEGLQEMGERFLTATLLPESVALYRIAMAEAQKYPDFAAEFQKLGAEHVRATVSAYLDERVAAGEARPIDTDWAASFFLEIVRARHLFFAMTRPNFTMTPEEITRSVARAIDVIVYGLKAR